MLEMKEYVNIKDFSTLKVGGQFRYFTTITNKEDIFSLYKIIQSDEKYKNIPFFILGGGSNIVFSDGILNVIVLKIEIKGFEVVSQYEDYVFIKVGAGEIWDEIVSRTVDMGFSGFECLSAIPGTVGAGPVQNIGAYGSEIKDTIFEVEVFDIDNLKFKTLLNKECNFKYRDSIFKNSAKGKYIITSVVYKLKNISPSIPNYPGVIKYFEDKQKTNPSLREIREAIIYIRKEKLPDPKIIPNVGSFFKNPIVLNSVASRIKKDYPNIKLFIVDSEYTKIPAGWLIENSSLKGKSFGNVSVYDKNALVLINTNDASFEDIILARNEIIKKVQDKFGITLEQEPELI